MATWKERNALLLAGIHPIFASRVLRFIDEMEYHGVPVLITQGTRTWEEQAALFAKGRTVMGESCKHGAGCTQHPMGLKVTNARPGQSWHNLGLAVDVVPDDMDKAGLQPDWNVSHPVWKQLLGVAKQFMLAEGADWRTLPDYPHLYPFELPPSPSDEVRDLYVRGGMKSVWNWFSNLAAR